MSRTKYQFKGCMLVKNRSCQEFKNSWTEMCLQECMRQVEVVFTCEILVHRPENKKEKGTSKSVICETKCASLSEHWPHRCERRPVTSLIMCNQKKEWGEFRSEVKASKCSQRQTWSTPKLAARLLALASTVMCKWSKAVLPLQAAQTDLTVV